MNENKTTIEFVNHASVLIRFGKIGILSDPWYSKSVFHHGWRLLYENENKYINEVLDRTSHIYISHEHPDHFNPSFLLTDEIKRKNYRKKNNFLIPKNERQKSGGFFKKKGFKVREFNQKKNKIENLIEIEIVKHDFYDSSISIKTPDIKILNLNDCPLRDVGDIKKI